MKKILVAGASGYLGKYITEEVSKQGYCVKVLVRNPKKFKRNNIKVEELINGKAQVFTQGENVESLFTITEGEAHVARNTENGYVPLANLYQGDFFGHVPFLDIGQEPYSASVFGSKDLKISEMDPDILKQEYNQFSSTFKNFIEHLANCILVTSMLACEFGKNIGIKKTGTS